MTDTLTPVGQKVVEILEDYLPPVSVFVGMKSVGKWTTAVYLADHMEVHPSDRLLISHLNITRSREIERFSRMPPTGHTKLVAIRMRGASQAAQDALLKTLEEAPVWSHFILVAEGLPSETLASRAHVYSFTPLSNQDVSQVLQRVKRMPSGQADVLARRGGGQVSQALAYGQINEHKSAVSLVLKAFRERDPVVLEKAAMQWTDDHTELLTLWCYEAMSGRWKIFSAEETGEIPTVLPPRILQAMKSKVRPRLVIRSQLMAELRRLM